MQGLASKVARLVVDYRTLGGKPTRHGHMLGGKPFCFWHVRLLHDCDFFGRSNTAAGSEKLQQTAGVRCQVGALSANARSLPQILLLQHKICLDTSCTPHIGEG